MSVVWIRIRELIISNYICKTLSGDPSWKCCLWHNVIRAQWIWYGSVADPDPGSGAFLTPGSGMGKKTGYGPGMYNPGHISESLEIKFFGFKYLNSLMRIRDLGWEKFGSRIRDEKNSDPG